jgi:hypothetical protein
VRALWHHTLKNTHTHTHTHTRTHTRARTHNSRTRTRTRARPSARVSLHLFRLCTRGPCVACRSSPLCAFSRGVRSEGSLGHSYPVFVKISDLTLTLIYPTVRWPSHWRLSECHSQQLTANCVYFAVRCQASPLDWLFGKAKVGGEWDAVRAEIKELFEDNPDNGMHARTHAEPACVLGRRASIATVVFTNLCLHGQLSFCLCFWRLQ